MKAALEKFQKNGSSLLFVELLYIFDFFPFDPERPYRAIFYDQSSNSLERITGISREELSEIIVNDGFYESPNSHSPNLWINLRAPFIVGSEMRDPITEKVVISFFQGFGHRNGLVIEPSGIPDPREFHAKISQARDKWQGIIT
ncbi:MAG: hypothetical protein HZC02_01510 [Candidatus Levybacteria bacterium]|nr:hypothetical protein [Candidatus Levybacteria bacterium]